MNSNISTPLSIDLEKTLFCNFNYKITLRVFFIICLIGMFSVDFDIKSIPAIIFVAALLSIITGLITKWQIGPMLKMALSNQILLSESQKKWHFEFPSGWRNRSYYKRLMKIKKINGKLFLVVKWPLSMFVLYGKFPLDEEL